MCAVAVAIKALVPDMPWAAAFTLGAIVAPTDPVAATTIMRRMAVPRRLVTVVEGESLINDGTALVAYGTAVTVALGATFSFWEASLDFVVSAVGGVAIGLAAGWVIVQIRRRIDDIPVEITISLLSGFAGYVPAEALGVSGVLAAVTTGIVLGWKAPYISTASMRLQGYAVWEILTFLLNALLFVLIGLQLPLDRGRALRPAGRRAAVVVRRRQPRGHRHAADLEPVGRLRHPGARPSRVAARAPLDLAEPDDHQLVRHARIGLACRSARPRCPTSRSAT